MFADIETPILYLGFLAFIALMLFLDLGVIHRKTREVTITESIVWTLVWVSLSLAFAGILYLGIIPGYGVQEAQEYLTGYLLEQALSVDNMFVFVVIFGAFAVPATYQHRVLFWGILGAVVLRGVFILAGAAVVARFHWVLYFFGVILLWTGGKLLFGGDDEDESDEEKGKKMRESRTVRLMKKLLGGRMTEDFHRERFFVMQNGVRYATPLLLVLCVIELSDVLFALDSIPAIFAVTTNSFIVFTSNMFAILGLRNIYFVLQKLLPMFRFLKYGVSLVLVFIALKILTMDAIHLIGWEHFPTSISLGVVALLLIGSILLSWLVPEKKKHPVKHAPPEPVTKTEPPPAATE